jgi:hypothetical protein
MISLRIEEVKSFMALLLTNTLFDELIVREMEIQTFTSFNISGQLHQDFFTEDELKNRGLDQAVLWGEIRGIAFSIIRGSKSPLLMKIVFQLPSNQSNKLVESLAGKLHIEDVGGLYMNIRFENNVLHIITGTAIKTFTLDKTLDIEWDEWVKRFLAGQGIQYAEE